MVYKRACQLQAVSSQRYETMAKGVSRDYHARNSGGMTTDTHIGPWFGFSGLVLCLGSPFKVNKELDLQMIMYLSLEIGGLYK